MQRQDKTPEGGQEGRTSSGVTNGRRISRRRQVAITIGIAIAAIFIINIGVRVAVTTARIPSPEASARRVLDTYLEAAKSQNCDMTFALTNLGSTWSWCGGFSPIRVIMQNNPRMDSYEDIGKPYEIPAKSTSSGRDETCFPVDITQSGLSGAESGALPGWGICFAQTPVGWRAIEQGYG